MLAAPTADVLRVREWRAKHEKQILAELIQLISLPNLAANRADIVKNADALTAMFEKRGFAVTRFETKGNAGGLCPQRRRRVATGTLTFYMHYDGQPPTPKDWTLGAAVRAGGVQRRHARRPAVASAARSIRTLRIYGRVGRRRQGPDRRVPRRGRRTASSQGDAAVDAFDVVLDGEEEAARRTSRRP